MCKFSGKSPLTSHKTMLKQQINGQKRGKMKEKDLFLLSFYSLFGAWKISLLLSVFIVYLLSVVLWLDKGHA